MGQSRHQLEWQARVQGGASLAWAVPLPWNCLLQQSLRTRMLQAGHEEVPAGKGKARRLHKPTCMTLLRRALQQVQAKGPTPRPSAVAQGV